MLDALRKQVGHSGSGLAFIKEAAKQYAAISKKKPKFSTVAFNRAIKLVKKAGMVVTDVKVSTDGSVKLSVAENGSTSSEAENPFDVVLK